MKSISVFFLIAILFLTIISYSSGRILLSPEPEIKFDGSDFDFGVVKQGENLEHIFKFTNYGDGALVIISVQPSYGCTGLVMDEKKEFKQGEEGEIKISFNTQGREGINTKTVMVNTNDPVNPVVTLSFKCEIENK